MADILTTEELQQKEAAMWLIVDEKVKELSDRLKKTVHPIAMLDVDNNGEYVIGYFTHPDMTAQLRMIDMSQEKGNGFSYEAASKMLESLLIKEESDPKINQTQDGERYWKGALPYIMEFMIAAVPLLKKK